MCVELSSSPDPRPGCLLLTLVVSRLLWAVLSFFFVFFVCVCVSRLTHALSPLSTTKFQGCSTRRYGTV